MQQNVGINQCISAAAEVIPSPISIQITRLTIEMPINPHEHLNRTSSATIRREGSKKAIVSFETHKLAAAVSTHKEAHLGTVTSTLSISRR